MASGEAEVDPVLLGLLYNLAEHEPVKVTRLPGTTSFHDSLAALGLLEWMADGRAVVSEAGWRLIERRPFPSLRAPR